MNRLITLLVVLFGTINLGIAQEVPEQQQSLLTKITATWCPNCGSWGWSFFEDIYEDNSNKALLYTCHYSGDLVNPVAQEFATNFNISYQPKFLFSNVNQEVTSSNAAGKRTSINDQVNAAWETPPVVNAGLEVVLDDNTFIVNAKTRFFQATSGDYYVGVYVIEDGVVNFQSGQGSGAIHKNVLRGSMGGNSFGEPVASGDIAAGTEFDLEFNMTLDPDWDMTKLKFATIVWKKEGETYFFQNTHYTSTIMEPVSTEDLKQQDLTMQVYPSLISENATVELNLASKQSDVLISLIDLSGKALNTIFAGDLPAGVQTFEIDRSMVKSGGLYFVMLQSQGETITKKVVFQ